MFSARSTRFITRAVLTLGLVVGCLVGSPVGFAQTPADGQEKVKIEWLGHEFYRLTSPKGVVVITSPWLANPDGPVPLESLARTDFILVPNAHNDDMEIRSKSPRCPARQSLPQVRWETGSWKKDSRRSSSGALESAIDSS
jgi:hypothetical protein